MNWSSVLGLFAAVAVATLVYAVALVVMDDADEDIDAEEFGVGGFGGEQLSEFD